MVATHPETPPPGGVDDDTNKRRATVFDMSWTENRSRNQLRRVKGAAANIAVREVRIRLFQSTARLWRARM